MYMNVPYLTCHCFVIISHSYSAIFIIYKYGVFECCVAECNLGVKSRQFYLCICICTNAHGWAILCISEA